MIVPGGGISPDGERWVSCRSGFFLPVRVLSRLFRRLFLEKLVAAHQADRLSFFGNYAHLADAQSFAAHLAPLRKAEWVVYTKRPFGEFTTGLLVSMTFEDRPETFVIRESPSRVDLARLVQVTAVADELIRGTVSPGDAQNVQNALAGNPTGPADANFDGLVTAADLDIVNQYMGSSGSDLHLHWGELPAKVPAPPPSIATKRRGAICRKRSTWRSISSIHTAGL